MHSIYSFAILICLAIAILVFLALLYTSITFWMENEKRATYRALLITLVLPVPYLLPWYYSWEIVAAILCIDLLLTLIAFAIPFSTPKNICDDFPKVQIDERDIMFSRNELKVDMERYTEYYKNHPEKEELDNKFRKEAGLLDKKSIFYNSLAYAASNASFFTVDQFKNAIDGPVNPVKEKISQKEMLIFLENWGKKLGALNLGFTKLSDYHYYSHKGRGDRYGEKIKNHHSYAIAFTVEMAQEMVAAAPQASIVMESGQQYLEAGRIAVQIGQFLRNLGYSAKAHIDGNYEVLCPLVARDAGLGEIGRMGLLMTPKEGPRVRLGVITTDFVLPSNQKEKDNSLLDFCNRCMKCADTCPSQSISFESPKLVNGTKRWQINSESCFTYWSKAGTDCGRCMATCPYSHPNNLLHNSIRWGIKHSPLFRRLAVPMDDFFYGRKPKSVDMPSWIPQKNKANLN
jgi:reductive dehalogenase